MSNQFVVFVLPIAVAAKQLAPASTHLYLFIRDAKNSVGFDRFYPLRHEFFGPKA
jgi:hypothetical protein